MSLDEANAIDVHGTPVVVRIPGESAWQTRGEIESMVRAEMPAGVLYEVHFEPATEAAAV